MALTVREHLFIQVFKRYPRVKISLSYSQSWIFDCCAACRRFDPRTEQIFVRPTNRYSGSCRLCMWLFYVCKRIHDTGIILRIGQRSYKKKGTHFIRVPFFVVGGSEYQRITPSLSRVDWNIAIFRNNRVRPQLEQCAILILVVQATLIFSQVFKGHAEVKSAFTIISPLGPV